MLNIEEIKCLVENHRTELIRAADRIWDFAEERFTEFQSSKLQMDILKPWIHGHNSLCSPAHCLSGSIWERTSRHRFAG